MDYLKVGRAIRKLRVQAGYKQHDLAESLGVTDQAVSKWERGLSVPDISIITRLAALLNVDVDNLLEGNITYLDTTWQGLLILKGDIPVYSGSEAFGKPVVYFFLAYFMLAGIREIYISCPERDRSFIEDRFGDGSRLGIRLVFLEDDETVPPNAGNTMVVFDNPFLYGLNLTKYFQRAMSRLNGITVMTVDKKLGREKENKVHFDYFRAIDQGGSGRTNHYCVPILFFPKKYFDQISKAERTVELEPLFAEPMSNGMIEYLILDEESLWNTASFVRYLKTSMGTDIYDLEEIAHRRHFLTKEHSLNQ